MTPLSIRVVEAHPAALTASPGVVFRLEIVNASGTRVHAIVLRAHVRIEPRGRSYSLDEQARVYELFGRPSDWHRTLRGVMWAQATLAVPSFEHDVDVELHVPITYDLEVASAKYLSALREGDIPLVFLFSGTVFAAAGGSVQIVPVSWDLEASFHLPAITWHAAMERFFPGGGWLRLRRETIDRLQAFRGRQAVVTWDEAIDRLLQHAEREQPA